MFKEGVPTPIREVTFNLIFLKLCLVIMIFLYDSDHSYSTDVNGLTHSYL